MSIRSDIKNDLITLIKQVQGGMDSFTAEVLDVDITTRTCTVLSISTKVETEYPGVWLMPEINDGLLYIPTIGSTVVVQNNVNMQPYIAMWSSIDKVLYVSGGSTFQIDADGLKLDGDKYGGLTKTQELQTQINKLNTLVSHLVTIINGTPIPEPGSGAASALQAALKGAITTDTVGDFSNIENTKVLHGDGS